MASAWGMFSNETIDIGDITIKMSEILAVGEIKGTGGLFPDTDKLVLTGCRVGVTAHGRIYYGTREYADVAAEWKAWLAKSEATHA